MTKRSEFRAVATVARALLLIGVLSAWPRGAAAQGLDDAKSLEDRVAALEQGVQGTAVAGPKGFALKSTDGNFELKIRGYVQADGRFFFGDDAEKLTDTFLLRRIRPTLDGKLGEYVQSSHEVRRVENSATLDNEACHAAASWVLTGEDNSFKRIKPKRPFEPSQGQWGAVELVARFSALDFDDNAFPTYADPTKAVASVETVGAGVNWYLTENIRASLDYEQGSFEGGGAAGDRPDEQVLFARWQVAFRRDATPNTQTSTDQ